MRQNYEYHRSWVLVLRGYPQILKGISQSTDEIVFQLYQGRSHFSNIETCINSLSQIRIPFKVGLLHLQGAENIEPQLRDITQYRGLIIFVKKWLL